MMDILVAGVEREPFLVGRVAVWIVLWWADRDMIKWQTRRGQTIYDLLMAGF